MWITGVRTVTLHSRMCSDDNDSLEVDDGVEVGLMIYDRSSSGTGFSECGPERKDHSQKVVLAAP